MADAKPQAKDSSSKDSGTSSTSSKASKGVTREELDELKGRISALENASSGRA